MDESYQTILDFWFAPRMEELWYADDPKFDADIRNRFMSTYEAARDGKLDVWRERASSMLGLIIVLDQFPRNMFRGGRGLLPRIIWRSRSLRKESEAASIRR